MIRSDMSNRKASIDEYNTTYDNSIDGENLNRAILMSFSDSLSSTQHDCTTDSLPKTLKMNSFPSVDSAIVEQTISLPIKQCTKKIIGNEILINPYDAARREAFVSRVPKYSEVKPKRTAGLNDGKKSKEVEMTENFYIENIKQSNLWPALTALETSLHSSDERISADDTDILKKLNEDFTCSPREFTATLMTIIEESFGEWEEENGDVSRFGLMELLKTTANCGRRLEDESPPEFMFSCFAKCKQTGNEAENNPVGPDCKEQSVDRFISLPSESQMLKDKSPQSSYSSIDALTVNTGNERIITKEPKKCAQSARKTVQSDTSVNVTNCANYHRDQELVKRMPRSPVGRQKKSVNFERIEDESPQSYSSPESLTMTTSTARISTKKPQNYAQTPRVTVQSGTSNNSTKRTVYSRRNGTPVRRMFESPIDGSKTSAETLTDITGELTQSSYLSLGTLKVSTDTRKTSIKEGKKCAQTPRIIIDSGTPIKSTKRAAICRSNRTPVKRMLRSPLSRPKISKVSFEDIVDHPRGSSIWSPLSNKDDDDYLTAESGTEGLSEVSETIKTDESSKRKLNMSNIESHHRQWVTSFEQYSKYTCNTALRTAERKRRLSNHTNKLEMRWLKNLTEKRQKCFDLVDKMLQKSVSDASEPEVKSLCSSPSCKLSKEFCSTLLALHEYMQFATHVPEIMKKNDNHRYVTRMQMNLKSKNSKSPHGARKSMSKQPKSLNKGSTPRFLSSRLKLTTSPRNRGLSPKKLKETCVDTSSIRPVSQLRRVFSPTSGTAGCSRFKDLRAKQTIPKKIPSSIGSGTKSSIITLPGDGPTYYKNVISPVGEYIRGNKTIQSWRPKFHS